MKLNNKGITLIEIIISIVLISIVLIFIFSLLIEVNNMNKKSEINSSYLINKALIIKNIEEDIKDSNTISLSKCDNGIKSFYTSYGVNPDYFNSDNNNKANMCIKLTLNKGEEKQDAYLAIYYYHTSIKSTYVISYINTSTNVRATRELPDFIDNNVQDGMLKNCTNIEINYNDGLDKLSNSSNNCSLDKKIDIVEGVTTITIPVIGSDGKDYSLIIPYYPKSDS